MDIVIVSQYLRNIESFEENNSRFVYLAKLLTQNADNEVEIITSDFNHSAKTHFKRAGTLPGVKVTMLHEPGYPRNVTLRRFASHKVLAKNVDAYLKTRKKPDVCYCAIPSLDVADVVARYCAINNVKLIIDIQDLWPEAFKMVFHVPVLCDLVFAPMEHKANRIYKAADHIVAVSKTYSDRAMRVNRRCKLPAVVYLGTEKRSFDRYVQNTSDALKEKWLKNTREIVRIAYCGTLGSSYDLECVIDAIRQMNVEDRAQIELIVMGDGPKKEKLVDAAKDLPVTFTGRMIYKEMVQLLSLCDIAINPIVKGAAGSIINKHMDYAMAGLPVINTQECQEYRALVTAYHAGINCECENVTEVAEAIQTLVRNPSLRKKMGHGNRTMAEEKFDRERSYPLICQIICEG